MTQQQFMGDTHSLRADPIPLFSPRLAQQAVREQVQRVLREVADSGTYILGPNVEAFERELAGWLGGPREED